MATDRIDILKQAYPHVAAGTRGFVWPGDAVSMFRSKLICLRAIHGPP